MPMLSIEHTTTAYRSDFVLYGCAVAGLSAWLALRSPAGMGLQLSALVAAGLLGWSGLEYALHRFVLHGLPPFKGWHREHHLRPNALICAPTWLSAALIGSLVWLPAMWWLGEWLGGALTLGVLIGYLGYAVTHHALHHWSAQNVWLQRRKYWHAKHHHLMQPCCFGVTSGVWDRVFRTAGHKHHSAPVRIPVRRHNG
jgi:sterol desaturase/sphingolipid hydroxylase (fatty acid hydroxylase superfamily)